DGEAERAVHAALPLGIVVAVPAAPAGGRVVGGRRRVLIGILVLVGIAAGLRRCARGRGRITWGRRGLGGRGASGRRGILRRRDPGDAQRRHQGDEHADLAFHGFLRRSSFA